MKKQLRSLLFLGMLMTAGVVNAQDARFSQFFNNPLVLNPGTAGNGIEYIRVTGIYRTQWAGLGNPFTTQGFAVDKVVNRVGLGGVITRNGTGDAGIRTLNIAGNISYNLPLGDSKEHILSAGLQVGVFNKSFDESKMTFDNQYSTDNGYDPNISSGEIFTNTSITRPDVSAGIFWQRGWLNKDILFKPFAGIGIAHINRPDETFIIDDNRMPVKKTFFFGAGYMLNDYIEIRPSAMILRQDQFKETTIGTMVNYELDNKNAVQLGVYNRFNDALIAYAGYKMNLVAVGVSYDVNTSSLSTSGKGTNAFELSLTYSPRPRRAKEPKEIQAPKNQRPQMDDISESPAIGIEENHIQIPDELAQRQPLENPASTLIPAVEKQEVAAVAEPLHVKQEVTEPIAQQLPAVAEKAPELPVPADFDNDGIFDNEDECPYIKGTNATGGCPDSDADGIIDMQDDCPMESGSKANKGCPDKNIPATAEHQELLRKFDNILFESGKTRLRTDDIFDIIERAIDIMYADKQTEVVLSGHTDAEGDEYQNMVLSQARIEVVRKYMINQGIDEKRIRSVAYGETMPLENNTTSEGKQLNRRVEINILKIK